MREAPPAREVWCHFGDGGRGRVMLVFWGEGKEFIFCSTENGKSLESFKERSGMILLLCGSEGTKSRGPGPARGCCSGPKLGEEGSGGDRSKLIPDTFLRQNDQDLVINGMWGIGQERNEGDLPISDLSLKSEIFVEVRKTESEADLGRKVRV